MGSVRNGVRRDDKYILAVDVGTSSIRCHVYDRAARSKGFSSKQASQHSLREVCLQAFHGTSTVKVNRTGACVYFMGETRQPIALSSVPHKQIELLYPNPGYVEMDPDLLFDQFVAVVKNAVEDSGLQMKQMAALGISAQRATFVTWNKRTGKAFHNFICWQDLRAAELVRSWNNSFLLQAIHVSSRILHFITRQKRFLAASVIKFSTQHVSVRLLWVMQNLKQVQEAASEGNCCFGTIDTWLLHRLTEGAVFATDFSNASTTGMFDPFQMCWSEFLASMLSFPVSILPPVEDTSHKFGSTDSSVFGISIPITALTADQQSAMFGECCFDIGDVKLTMGSGTFLAINTGTKPHASVSGLYPLVGWKIGPDITYLAEGNSADTGVVIKWAKELGFFSDPDETAKMAQEVVDSDGVFFVPSFSGLQVPVNDPYACASLMGLKPSTTKNHLVRAVLESIAFRNKQLYNTMLKETRIPVTHVRADGGISNNAFVMQLTSDLLACKIEKPQCSDMSSLGAAFLAGLAIGFWESKAEVKKLRLVEKVYNPRDTQPVYEPIVDKWEKAIKRSMHWYCKT